MNTGPLHPPAEAEPPHAPSNEALQRQIFELQLEQLKAENRHISEHIADHEERMRSLEAIGTRFNTLYAMFAGNGLMSIIILVKLFTDKP